MIQYITYIYIQKERSFFSQGAGDRTVTDVAFHRLPHSSTAFFLSALHQQPNMPSVAAVWIMLCDERMCCSFVFL